MVAAVRNWNGARCRHRRHHCHSILTLDVAAPGNRRCAWVVAVLLKVIWAVPTNAIVRQRLLRVAGESLGKPLYWAYIAS